MNTHHLTLRCIGVPLPALVGTSAQNWPQVRGADSLGTVENTALPDLWSQTENVAWKALDAGMGWSSPVVWGTFVVLITAVSEGEGEKVMEGLYLGGDRPARRAIHEWRALFLDLKSGQSPWEKVVHRGVLASAPYLKNAYASETPVTDGERVYHPILH